MRKFNLLFAVVAALAAAGVGDCALAASKKSSKQSAIQKGTQVRAKTEATGLYDQECYDAYYGCMDQFCISGVENGGSCACSDLSIKYEKQLADIQATFEEAERIATVEVEKIQAGAKADIIFNGERRYDEDGNIIAVDEVTKEDARKNLLAMFEQSEEEEEEDYTSAADFSSLKGVALYAQAEELCLEQVPESCEGDMKLLRNMYSRQITSDCKAYENSLAVKQAEAKLAMSQAESDVRNALKESFDEANKYGLGQCVVEFKKCMQTEDACGDNWENCVAEIASVNMQNKSGAALMSASESAKVTEWAQEYDITMSTMESLSAKRIICERVLDNCISVRDMVWPTFLREAAPTIKVAESAAESKFRSSCLTDIADCIHTACKDDIVGKGIDTMDACLSRPEMVRSFCKVELEPCEAMEPLIWGYVKDKLAAMRVDACTAEVRDCFTASTRCGTNFQNCIGMDYDYIHDMCPVDSLVVCKANNPNFKIEDLDSVLMGLYLNIDNTLLDRCQELIDTKMAELCGSTTDCNRFAADEIIGTNSLRSQKDGAIYRVTGMISFGSIKMGDGSGRTTDAGEDSVTTLRPGEIGVQEYLKRVSDVNMGVPNSDGIISAIEEELNNIAGTINRTIEMIEQDPEIQFCVNGRDLSQITGDDGARTAARYPNMLNTVKMQIAVAALNQAQINYNKKLTQLVADATKDASADVAQYMCHKVAEFGVSTLDTPDIDLAPPFAITYDVASGLTAEDLAKGGHGTLDLGGVKFNNSSYLGGNSTKLSGGTKETTALFNREKRICHICTTTIAQDCKTKGSVSWFHNNRNMECTARDPIEKCEDVPM